MGCETRLESKGVRPGEGRFPYGGIVSTSPAGLMLTPPAVIPSAFEVILLRVDELSAVLAGDQPKGVLWV